MTVSGIGGVFFRTRDPEALTEWYRAHFGVTMQGYVPWRQAAGPTVFMPFASSTGRIEADQRGGSRPRILSKPALMPAKRASMNGSNSLSVKM